MSKSMFPSDTIAFKISTGDNSAGDGGEGYNSGKIASNPSIEFEPSNKAAGCDVHVDTGDKVYQKAYWDAGGANAEAEKYAKAAKYAEAEKYAKAEGGTAKSNGDQESYSGHNKCNVDANTEASQENWLDADQSQNVKAGVGGDGGNGNKVEGGDVDIKASIEWTNLNDVLNHSEHFHTDDVAHG
jgi:hypothetical protein